MFQITVLRISLILIIGIISFGCLSYAVGLKECRHLKKRRKNSKAERKETKTGILLIYLMLMFIGVVLLFQTV